MTRLIGYVQFGSEVERAVLDGALRDAAAWIKEILLHPVTIDHMHAPRCNVVALGAKGGDLTRSERGVAAVDTGVVVTGEETPVGGVASYLLKRLDHLDSALHAIRGDFAGALFDEHTDTLHLVRDHFGARPIFYFHGRGFVAWSSHPGALLFFPGCSRRANRRYVALVAASHYRTFDNQPEESPFRDIKQVPARSIVTFSGTTATTRRYWDLIEPAHLEVDERETAAEYRRLLLQAVARRLPETPQRGFTLSGGMDSSSVISCASHLLGERQEAYSCVYADKTYDETSDIATIIDDVVSRWHTIPVDIPDVFGLINQMVLIHGDVVATATWLAHYVLMQHAAKAGVTHLFGGLGGDELNAGEYEHFFPFFADIRAEGDDATLEAEIAAWAHHHNHPIFTKDRDVALQTMNRVTDPHVRGRCLPDSARLRTYAATFRREQFDVEAYEPVMDHPFTSYLHNRAYQDLFRETTPCCLRAQDRHGAAFGITHVNPFLDVDVVEFMFRVSPRLKIRKGVTKFVLREAMKGILPESTRTRVAKTGWNAPAHVWFSGAGLDTVRALVRSQDFRLADVYDCAQVEALLDDHETVITTGALRTNHMMFIWQMVNLEAWLRGFDVQW